MISQEELKAAQDKFNKIIEEQLTRIDAMKSEGDFIDYSKKDHIEIGVVGGDGIGPFITKEAQRVLEFLLKKDIESNRITIRNIDG